MSKFAIFALASVVMSACASAPPKDTTPECVSLRQQFSDAGLIIDAFRDTTIADPIKASDLRKKLAYDEIAVKGTRPGMELKRSEETVFSISQHYDLFTDQLKFHAGRTCGYINEGSGPNKGSNRIPNDSQMPALTVERILADLKQCRKDFAQRSQASQQAKQEVHSRIEKIDINAPYVIEEKFNYPSYRGLLKEEAQKKRKRFFQKSVLTMVGWFALIANKNPQISNLLDSSLQIPLTNEQKEVLTEEFQKRLGKFDISLNPDAGEYDGFGDHPVKIATDLNQFFDGSEGLSQAVKSKEKRTKLLAALMIMNTTLEAKRISPEEFQITVTLDFPSFFKAYPLKNIDDFVEK